MLWARVLADAIVVVHVAWVSFVVLGMAVIVVGLGLGWGWVRNFWFRVVHLAMIGVVAAEALVGISCLLTDWEKQLRHRAGQTTYPGDFIGHWAHRLIFFHAPPWVFTVAYVAFAAAVLAAFLLGPPRLPRRARSNGTATVVERPGP
jgi:Protein of Unknown function (DUF2784)